MRHSCQDEFRLLSDEECFNETEVATLPRHRRRACAMVVDIGSPLQAPSTSCTQRDLFGSRLEESRRENPEPAEAEPDALASMLPRGLASRYGAALRRAEHRRRDAEGRAAAIEAAAGALSSRSLWTWPLLAAVAVVALAVLSLATGEEPAARTCPALPEVPQRAKRVPQTSCASCLVRLRAAEELAVSASIELESAMATFTADQAELEGQVVQWRGTGPLPVWDWASWRGAISRCIDNSRVRQLRILGSISSSVASELQSMSLIRSDLRTARRERLKQMRNLKESSSRSRLR